MLKIIFLRMGGISIGWHCVGVLSPVSIKIFQSMYDEWAGPGWSPLQFGRQVQNGKIILN